MPVDPRDAVRVLAVIDAARVSAAEGRVVPVATPSAERGPLTHGCLWMTTSAGVDDAVTMRG